MHKRKNVTQRQRRHERLRKKVSGTAQRPRLCIYRALSHLNAQIIDDMQGKTLLSLSTFDKDVKPTIKYGGNTKAAEALGKIMAEKAKAKGITSVVFDRGGCLFHGRVKAFAEAMRKQGIVF